VVHSYGTSQQMNLFNCRFLAPWAFEEMDACFLVRDRSGKPLAHVYFQEEPGRRLSGTQLTRNEARRIAASIARLPQLLQRPQY
jgi:hypothetical protein